MKEGVPVIEVFRALRSIVRPNRVADLCRACVYNQDMFNCGKAQHERGRFDCGKAILMNLDARPEAEGEQQ